MRSAQHEARWELSSDALMLLALLDVFFWFGMLLSGQRMVDYSVLYTGGGLVRGGHGRLLFDAVAQADFQHRVLGLSSLLPFNHLAYEALLFVPLAGLSYRASLLIWQLLSLGFLLLSAQLLAKSFHRRFVEVALLAGAFLPTSLTVRFGQDSLLLLLLFSASLLALRQGREQLGGFLLAMALFKPHFVLPLALMLLWRRGTSFRKGFLGGAVGVGVLSTAVTGVAGWRQLLSLMRYAAYGTGDWMGGVASMRPDLRGFLALLGVGPQSAVWISVAIAALLFLLIAWLLRHPAEPEKIFSPLIAYTLAASIYLIAHDLSLLMIPILALLEERRRATLICVFACYSLPLLRLICGDAPFFLVLCALLVLTVRQSASRQGNELAAESH